jgi:hypothetical protein
MICKAGGTRYRRHGMRSMTVRDRGRVRSQGSSYPLADGALRAAGWFFLVDHHPPLMTFAGHLRPDSVVARWDPPPPQAPQERTCRVGVAGTPARGWWIAVLSAMGSLLFAFGADPGRPCSPRLAGRPRPQLPIMQHGTAASEPQPRVGRCLSGDSLVPACRDARHRCPVADRSPRRWCCRGLGPAVPGLPERAGALAEHEFLRQAGVGRCRRGGCGPVRGLAAGSSGKRDRAGNGHGTAAAGAPAASAAGSSASGRTAARSVY